MGYPKSATACISRARNILTLCFVGIQIHRQAEMVSYLKPIEVHEQNTVIKVYMCTVYGCCAARVGPQLELLQEWGSHVCEIS